MTPEIEFQTGTWLNAGDKFLQIDDTRIVEAEIAIPQNDIALVKSGARVRLRPWSERHREIIARVTRLAPTALDQTQNSVVVVQASIPNPEALLRPAMTGYAKISGPEIRLWEAYFRLCIRFFTVELWSWVP